MQNKFNYSYQTYSPDNSWNKSYYPILKHLCNKDKLFEKELLKFFILLYLFTFCFIAIILYNKNDKEYITYLCLFIILFFMHIFFLNDSIAYKSVCNIKPHEYIDELIKSDCYLKFKFNPKNYETLSRPIENIESLDKVIFDICVDYTNITNESKNINYHKINPDCPSVVELDLCVKAKDYKTQDRYYDYVCLNTMDYKWFGFCYFGFYQEINIKNFNEYVYLSDDYVPFFIKYGYIIYPIMGILGFGWVYEIIFWNFYAENRYNVEIRKLVGFNGIEEV
uniref:Uncharacterized protein n=1 Tax=viral metagenome TaxID=1070528 RepID=A0A6C0ADV9_9ZZZZ